MCDCLCALPSATSTGTTLFAKNSDRPPREAQVVERHEPRRDRAPLRATHIEVAPHDDDTIGFVGSRPEWMWGVEHGVNDARVAIGNETIYTTLDPRPFPDALLGMDLVRLGLERARSATEALDVLTALLERYGQGGSGHRDAHRPYWSSFLVADERAGYVLETSGREWAAERVDPVRAISNRTTIPAFDAAHRHPRQPVEHLVDPRLRASDRVLAAQPVSVDALRRHLRGHVGGEDGWTVCMHVDDVEATTASLVAELGDRRAVAHLLLGSPCRSIYVPVVLGSPLGDPPGWDRFAALPASARPALDHLEEALALEVRDRAGDPTWNAEAWRRVTTLVDAILGAAP